LVFDNSISQTIGVVQIFCVSIISLILYTLLISSGGISNCNSSCTELTILILELVSNKYFCTKIVFSLTKSAQAPCTLQEPASLTDFKFCCGFIQRYILPKSFLIIPLDNTSLAHQS